MGGRTFSEKLPSQTALDMELTLVCNYDPTCHLNTMPAIQESSGANLEPSVQVIELSFPLPKAPETKIHLRLTIGTISLLLFLTTVYGVDAPTAAPLGSFVYALPDVSLYFHLLSVISVFMDAHNCRGTILARPFLPLSTHTSPLSSSPLAWRVYWQGRQANQSMLGIR